MGAGIQNVVGTYQSSKNGLFGAKLIKYFIGYKI